MKLKFMDRALSEKHRENGLYVEQIGDDTIALMRIGKAMPVKEFDSRASLLDIVSEADRYLEKLAGAISFGRSVE